MINTQEFLDGYQWLRCRIAPDKLKCSGSGACGHTCCRMWVYNNTTREFLEGNDYETLDLLAHHQQNAGVSDRVRAAIAKRHAGK